MVKKICLMLIVLFLIVPGVLAVSVTVNTLQYHDVEIYILSTAGAWNRLVPTVFENSGASGSVVTSPSTGADEVDVAVIVKKDGNKLFYERFEDFSTSSPIDLWILVDEEEEEVVEEVVENVTIVEETDTIDGDSSNSGGFLTGSAIFGEEGFVSENWLYFAVVGGLIAIGLVLFIVGKKIKGRKRNVSGNINVVSWKDKLEQMKEEKEKAKEEDKMEEKQDDLETAMKKLKEAQEQVNKIQSGGKISELEGQIDAMKGELEKLKG